MAAFTITLQCSSCGKTFRLEANRMRSNSRNNCPSCGSVYSISEDQAVKAHRLSEQFELREKEARLQR